MGQSDVTVVHVVTAASSELWVVWFHTSTGVVEFERTAESVWDTGEESNIVVSNTSID